MWPLLWKNSFRFAVSVMWMAHDAKLFGFGMRLLSPQKPSHESIGLQEILWFWWGLYKSIRPKLTLFKPVAAVLNLVLYGLVFASPGKWQSFRSGFSLHVNRTHCADVLFSGIVMSARRLVELIRCNATVS